MFEIIIVAWWCLKVSQTFVITGLGNGLWPSDNNSLPEPMLTYHQRYSAALTYDQFHREYSEYRFTKRVWKIHLYKYFHISQGLVNLNYYFSWGEWVKRYISYLCLDTLAVDHLQRRDGTLEYDRRLLTTVWNNDDMRVKTDGWNDSWDATHGQQNKMANILQTSLSNAFT